MNNEQKTEVTIETAAEEQNVQTADESRRAFLKKYGKLAAVTPVAMTMTMHSKKALASSCTDCAP